MNNDNHTRYESNWDRFFFPADGLKMAVGRCNDYIIIIIIILSCRSTDFPDPLSSIAPVDLPGYISYRYFAAVDRF